MPPLQPQYGRLSWHGYQDGANARGWAIAIFPSATAQYNCMLKQSWHASWSSGRLPQLSKTSPEEIRMMMHYHQATWLVGAMSISSFTNKHSASTDSTNPP